MPRLYSGIGEPIDFCRFCFPTKEEAQELWDTNVHELDQSWFAHECDHPPYQTTGIPYLCQACGRTLGEDDD